MVDIKMILRKYPQYSVLFALAIIALLLANYLLNTTQVQLTAPHQPTQTIALPFYADSNLTNNQGVIYDFSFTMDYYTWLTPSKFRIIADNCLVAIEINFQPVDLSNFSKTQRCDTSRGVIIDFAPYLLYGDNTITLKIKDFGGVFGLDINHTIYAPNYLIFLLAITTLFIFFSYQLFQKLNLPFLTYLIFLLAVILRVIYCDYSRFDDRSHDEIDHLAYVKSIVTHQSLPDKVAEGCYGPSEKLCHHPATYYILAAIIYKTLDSTGWYNPISGLQIFSVLLSFGFLLFAILTLNLLIQNRPLFYLASSLVAFWPSGIMYSNWVCNDSLLYFLFMAACYFLTKWTQHNQPRDIYYAAIFTLLAMFTKTNAILLVAMVGLTLILKAWLNYKKTNDLKLTDWKQFGLICLLLLISFAPLLEPTIEYLNGHTQHILSSNLGFPGFNREQDMKTPPITFFYFDLPVFLTETFSNPGWAPLEIEPPGYTYHWNFFLKSSLFESFSLFWNGNVDTLIFNQIVARIMAFLLLILFIYACIGFLTLQPNDAQSFMVMSLMFPILLIGSMLYRLTAPSTLASNFKYVFPLIIAIAFFHCFSIQSASKKGWFILSALGYATGYLFCILSISFFIMNSFVLQ